MPKARICSINYVMEQRAKPAEQTEQSSRVEKRPSWRSRRDAPSTGAPRPPRRTPRRCRTASTGYTPRTSPSRTFPSLDARCIRPARTPRSRPRRPRGTGSSTARTRRTAPQRTASQGLPASSLASVFSACAACCRGRCCVCARCMAQHSSPCLVAC